ncbi:MAG TPA: hypothetical protein VMT46_15085 [Anaerolineaceae bacterium]|nr:hypothetical protein [Anaerolineaceae bacterium]
MYQSTVTNLLTILGTLFGVLLGSVSTFFITNWFEERKWKREKLNTLMEEKRRTIKEAKKWTSDILKFVSEVKSEISENFHSESLSKVSWGDYFYEYQELENAPNTPEFGLFDEKIDIKFTQVRRIFRGTYVRFGSLYRAYSENDVPQTIEELEAFLHNADSLIQKCHYVMGLLVDGFQTTFE